MPSSRGQVVVVFGIIVLLSAIVLQTRSYAPGETSGTSRLPMLSASIGVGSRPLALGNTEAASGAVEKVLQFDDVFFREFRGRRGTFDVYAAYWKPGKLAAQLVASHTPDRCWTEAGWQCVGQDYSLLIVSENIELLPGQGRTFEAPNTRSRHIVYWHLVGTELYDYGERFNSIPSPWHWWRDAAKQFFRSPPEQYFIRLSSERPFSEWRDDPAFQAVVSALAELGLRGSE